ncbi:glucosamine-6-phosphate deaminase [Propionibacterium cyclohexanicum]|uniref:Glucosamine-6-phosphate deaminase n=1 Tax=Propionibacterium cyclohexanicum TaxID=64702 RepID=A0A1H9TH08_9ACTN|nr:glucosamine-6-phosphate deaminase [Propionibacterium cyclohexanicum]SER96431.1 glucosamine-6-phosphate deaminase [Propionibacterium cyclohexanicum]
MEVIIVDNELMVARTAADLVSDLVSAQPSAVLGVATGSSPVGLYQELSRRVNSGELSLERCSAFMLDEYVGLGAEHPASYRRFIEEKLVEPTDLPPANVHGPDGSASDLVAECDAYEKAIASCGGVDLQILGIGTDGHIGFNEPASSLSSRTRIKTLTHQTRLDNSRFFDGDIDRVPHHCLTQGIGTIMDARTIVLVATGRKKADAIHRIVEGPVTARWPGSQLQHHPHVTVVVDEAAASELELHDYFVQIHRDNEWGRNLRVGEG